MNQQFHQMYFGGERDAGKENKLLFYVGNRA